MIKRISIVIPYKRQGDMSVLLWTQTRTSEPFKGLLEFPGGKIEKDESAVDAAVREVQEEVGISLTKGELDFLFLHQEQIKDEVWVHFHVCLTAAFDKFPDSELIELDLEVPLSKELAIPPANFKILEELIFYLKHNELRSKYSKSC